MRRLRFILGETLIEAGAALRLAGWFVLPDRPRFYNGKGRASLTLDRQRFVNTVKVDGR